MRPGKCCKYNISRSQLEKQVVFQYPNLYQGCGRVPTIMPEASNNLDKKVEESKGTRIDLGDVEVLLDI